MCLNPKLDTFKITRSFADSQGLLLQGTSSRNGYVRLALIAARGQKVTFDYTARRGYIYLKTNFPHVQKTLLLQSPLKNKSGTYMLQRWIPAVDPDNPKGLKIPTLGH